MSGSDPIAAIKRNSYTAPMRWIALAIPIALSACSRVENTFVVEDEQRAVATAKLVLCGTETPLRRIGGRLMVSKAIDCEGSGRITLRYASGGVRDCNVGYVTPGMVQSFANAALARSPLPLKFPVLS